METKGENSMTPIYDQLRATEPQPPDFDKIVAGLNLPKRKKHDLAKVTEQVLIDAGLVVKP